MLHDERRTGMLRRIIVGFFLSLSRFFHSVSERVARMSSVVGVLVVFVIGWFLGVNYGKWELRYIVEMPAGGVHMSWDTHAVWEKPVTSNVDVRIKAIPAPEVARMINMFPELNPARIKNWIALEEKLKSIPWPAGGLTSSTTPEPTTTTTTIRRRTKR